MQICTYLWVVFLIVWVIWGMRTKPVQTREGVSSRLSYTVLTIAAAYLMFSADVPRDWLRRPIFPATLWIEVLGIAIAAAGIAFAFWARAYLAGNWSSAVTVKVGHQLVRSGPYRWVRHPIYSGMIFAMFGTALNRGQLRGLIAVLLLYLGFKIKSRIEEQAMLTTFGAEYDEYSRTTGAIIPRFHS
ncbi:MAG: isoprenylcysteine carboxylmethyltransferase family protein [Candidatus Korobacteraceae bacterium]